MTNDEGVMKVGLLVGREWSFPPVFLEAVNKSQCRRDGRVCATRRHAHGRAESVCRHCRSHLPRSAVLPFLSQARGAARRATVVNNPFMWTADDKFFGAASPPSSASRTPRRWCCRTRTTSPASCTTESLRNLVYPVRLEADHRLRRAALRTKGCTWRRLEETSSFATRSTS